MEDRCKTGFLQDANQQLQLELEVSDSVTFDGQGLGEASLQCGLGGWMSCGVECEILMDQLSPLTAESLRC